MNKKNYKVIGVVLGIFFVIMIVGLSQNPSPSTKPSDSTSPKPSTKPKPNDIVTFSKVDAQVLCDIVLKQRAKYGYKSSIWDNEQTIKDNDYIGEDGKTQTVWLVTKPVKYQNGFGAYENMTGVCYIKTKAKYKDIEAYNGDGKDGGDYRNLILKVNVDER